MLISRNDSAIWGTFVPDLDGDGALSRVCAPMPDVCRGLSPVPHSRAGRAEAWRSCQEEVLALLLLLFFEPVVLSGEVSRSSEDGVLTQASAAG